MTRKIRKLDNSWNNTNAIVIAVTTVGTIYLMVQIGTSTERVTFLVTDGLDRPSYSIVIS